MTVEKVVPVKYGDKIVGEAKVDAMQPSDILDIQIKDIEFLEKFALPPGSVSIRKRLE